MTALSQWPSFRTAFATLNVNGWLRRPRESHRADVRRVSVMNMVKKHQLDVLGLQETHLQEKVVVESQQWWLQKHGFSGRFNLQQSAADKGSTGLIWRDAKWEHVSLQDVGSRFLISHLKAKAGGEVRVLTGHFSCEPTARRQQWGQIESKMSSLPPLPLVVLADHNNVMVPRSDSLKISKEVPTTGKARQVEGTVFSALAVEDASVHLHGERRGDELQGFTCTGADDLKRRIDKVHVPESVLHTVKSVYTVTTPSDHKAVVLQVGQPECATDPLRFRFLVELLESVGERDVLQAALLSVDGSSCGVLQWWEQVWVLLRTTAGRWRRDNPSAGYTELQALVRESSPLRLAHGAWEFLQDLGYEEPTVALAYQRLVRLQAQQEHEAFQEKMVERLRSQLQPPEVRSWQLAERKKRIHELVRQLRERQYLTRVKDARGVP